MRSPISSSRLVAIILGSFLVGIVSASTSSATVCIVPDDGSGTAALPPATGTPGCTDGYLSPDDVHMIIDGLPPGQTIAVTAEHDSFVCEETNPICSFPPSADTKCSQSGGSLGGEEECNTSNLNMVMEGTGGLAYNRTLNLPVNFETHIAPRSPGDPVQSFDTDMFRLQGQLPPGDPDFDLLRITGGTAFGMPSPGHTTLTRASASTWNVDSFFDITYRIDFVGSPGGPFAGMSGSTTGTIRMAAGEPAVLDHLECFKTKDTVKLKGLVDLVTSAPYGAAGCTVGPTKRYCTPVGKIVVSSEPAAVPAPGPPLTSDYVCYKLKCPKVDLSQTATDQFGSHTITKMLQKELCVPATRVP